MNKTMKVALCIGLAGLGVLVWTHSAAAKGKPPSTPVVVTFLSGDVSAAPQPLGGPFTATIDFAGYILSICPDSPTGGEAVLELLQRKNPITYDSLSISVSKREPLYSRLDFSVTLEGVPYHVVMNAFLSGTTKSEPTLDTFHWSDGRFAVQSKNTILVVAGHDHPDGKAKVDFSMTK
ncbi:MAG: hypothetical protein NTZ17_04040 [Phycisphaerae bacterium]|nr:hypothetical protein [Phycisphaerae bacterium]